MVDLLIYFSIASFYIQFKLRHWSQWRGLLPPPPITPFFLGPWPTFASLIGADTIERILPWRSYLPCHFCRYFSVYRDTIPLLPPYHPVSFFIPLKRVHFESNLIQNSVSFHWKKKKIRQPILDSGANFGHTFFNVKFKCVSTPVTDELGRKKWTWNLKTV